MAEKFRIDLGYDQLFGSQSIDPDSSAGTNRTVVYDTTKQTFYYTGSYGGGGGGSATGSFTGSFTGSLIGTATIGPAEDNDYTDGLFTDFTNDTLVGTPIDRFNEVLKALAPSPAPNLSSLGDEETNFTSCSLSFGTTTNSIAGVTNVETVGTLAALNVSGTFPSTKSFDGGEDYRIGINNSTTAQDITGKLNQAAAENGGSGVTVNFSASAFGEGNVGKLFLYVNTGPTDGGLGSGTPTVELDLESSDSAITVDNTNGTLTVGATSSGFFPQGTAFTNFTHRTGSYTVKVASQRQGMNYFRVVHTSSTFHRATNYIQFLNATQSSADITLSSDGSNFTGSGTKYLSGVKYHTDGRLDYTGSFSNYYKIVAGLSTTALNIEINGPTNFFEVARLFQSGSNTKVSTGTTSNIDSSTPLQEQVSDTHRVPLAFSASISGGLARANYYSLIVDNNDTSEDLVVRTDLSTVPNGKISDGTDIGAKTYRGLLLDARTTANNSDLETLQSESFVSESHRLRTLAFDTQASVTTSGNKWASAANILTSAGTNTTGLLVMPKWEDGGVETNGGGMLVYPDSSTVPENGDFSSFTNGPAGNPDYSGASGNLTYLRAFRNQSTNDLASFTLFLRSWSGTIDILQSGSTLQGNDIYLEVKLPGDTGFLDIGGAAQGSTDDLTANGAPGRLGTLTSIGTSATGFVVQTKNSVSGEVVHDDDYIVVKITTAHGFVRAIRSIGITDFIE